MRRISINLFTAFTKFSSTICFLISLTGCGPEPFQNPGLRPHQNTIVTESGAANVGSAADTEWVKSSTTLYGEGLDGLFSVKPNGTGLKLLIGRTVGQIDSALISPEKRKVAFLVIGKPQNLYIFDIYLQTLTTFTLPSSLAGNTQTQYQNPPFSMTWSDDGEFVLLGLYNPDGTLQFWAINSRSKKIMRISHKPGPGLYVKLGAAGTEAAVTYFEGTLKLATAYSTDSSPRGTASNLYSFANGSKAYLDARSNLVVHTKSGDVIDVQPTMVIYLPWTTPPPAGSGIACDCGIPAGIQISPTVQGIVDGNYLIYRWDTNLDTWIFGLKENRKSVIRLPRGSTLLFNPPGP